MVGLSFNLLLVAPLLFSHYSPGRCPGLLCYALSGLKNPVSKIIFIFKRFVSNFNQLICLRCMVGPSFKLAFVDAPFLFFYFFTGRCPVLIDVAFSGLLITNSQLRLRASNFQLLFSNIIRIKTKT